MSTAPSARLRKLILLSALSFMLLPPVYMLVAHLSGRAAKAGGPALEEMRTLAPAPRGWVGRWFDVEKNWAIADRWFSDHVGLRTYMVRLKNEVDYQLFRSSRRVYFGKQGQLYGRNMADNELPHVERMFAHPQDIERAATAVEKLADQLQAKGVTMILVPVMSKQYYSRDLLPFFAPRVPAQSRFLALYRRLQHSGHLVFVDTDALLRRQAQAGKVFYDEDFHWTDVAARAVAAQLVADIALREKAPIAWKHPLQVEMKPFTGSETRFSSRLFASKTKPEPHLVKTWRDLHQVSTHDAALTGIEFSTGTVSAVDVLPATCMYGNSFSDGFIRAGLPDHFAQFTKFNRTGTIAHAATLTLGRCRYFIVQVLDSQANVWNEF